MAIEFRQEGLNASEQRIVSDGFQAHSEGQRAPEYRKSRVKWLVSEKGKTLQGVLVADILWDWVYVDELWVSPESRGEGLGKKLMRLAEDFVQTQGLTGIWLWTQSWQAEGFYRQLGYSEFTRFDDFPKGHCRIGFRKRLRHRDDG